MDLRRFCLPLWGPNFGTFSIKFQKVELQKRSFVRLVWSTQVFLQNCRKIADPRPLKCSKNIVNTVSDAMSPCSNQSSENDGLEVHFGGDLGSLWGQVGAKFHLRYVLFEVRILVRNRCLQQSPRAPGAPGSSQEHGGGSLREL